MSEILENIETPIEEEIAHVIASIKIRKEGYNCL